MTPRAALLALGFGFGLIAALPAAAADPSASAEANQPRIWIALSGDRLELDGQRARLRGVRCARPDTDEGRAAKALLNTFLRAGHVRCALRGGLADCTVNGRDINAEMRKVPGCTATDDPRPQDQDQLAGTVLERRICPADPDLPWRVPTGLGPMTEQLRLLLYSLHLEWRAESGGPCGP